MDMQITDDIITYKGVNYDLKNRLLITFVNYNLKREKDHLKAYSTTGMSAVIRGWFTIKNNKLFLDKLYLFNIHENLVVKICKWLSKYEVKEGIFANWCTSMLSISDRENTMYMVIQDGIIKQAICPEKDINVYGILPNKRFFTVDQYSDMDRFDIKICLLDIKVKYEVEPENRFDETWTKVKFRKLSYNKQQKQTEIAWFIIDYYVSKNQVIENEGLNEDNKNNDFYVNENPHESTISFFTNLQIDNYISFDNYGRRYRLGHGMIIIKGKHKFEFSKDFLNLTEVVELFKNYPINKSKNQKNYMFKF